MKALSAMFTGLFAFSVLYCGGSSGSIPQNPTVDTPVIQPSGGYFAGSQSVTILCSTSGAVIRYTTDGSTPTETYGVLSYGVAFTVRNTQTIKAVAYKSGWNTSHVAQQSFEIQSTVANPVFSVSGGYYADSQNVQISCDTSGATIVYTTDGSEPARNRGTVYSGESITISKSGSSVTSKTIRAFAFKSSCGDSSIVDAVYTITGWASQPVFDPSADTMATAFTMTLSLPSGSPDGSIIRYTTNGAEPSRSDGLEYTAPVTISDSCTVKAFSYVPSWSTSSDSEIISKTYTINGKVSNPGFTMTGESETVGGIPCFYGTVTVSIECATDGAAIYYTVNGGSEQVYNGSMILGVTDEIVDYKICAYARKDNYGDSGVTTYIFKVTPNVKDPVLSPDSGYYTDPVDIKITCDTADAVIYYTANITKRDGTVITRNDLIYSDPISLAAGDVCEIQSYATHAGQKKSSTVKRIYTVTGVVSTPVLTPSAHREGDPFEVVISNDQTSSIIVYTLDGSTPARTSPIYTGPVLIGGQSPGTIKLRAMAYVDEWPTSSDSIIASADYAVDRVVICSGTVQQNGRSYAAVWKNGKTIVLRDPNSSERQSYDNSNASITGSAAGRMYDNRETAITVPGYYILSIPTTSTVTVTSANGTESTIDQTSITNVTKACAWTIDNYDNVTVVVLDGKGGDSSNAQNEILSYAGNAGSNIITGYYTNIVASSDENSTSYTYTKYPCYWDFNGNRTVVSGSTTEGICWTALAGYTSGVYMDGTPWIYFPGFSNAASVKNQIDSFVGDINWTYNSGQNLSGFNIASQSYTIYSYDLLQSGNAAVFLGYINNSDSSRSAVAYNSILSDVSQTIIVNHSVYSAATGTTVVTPVSVPVTYSARNFASLILPDGLSFVSSIPFYAALSAEKSDSGYAYIAGYRRLSNLKLVATLWTGSLNSSAGFSCSQAPVDLESTASLPLYDSSANAVAVYKNGSSGDLVYAAGYYSLNAVRVPRIWLPEGGKITPKFEGNYFTVESISAR